MGGVAVQAGIGSAGTGMASLCSRRQPSIQITLERFLASALGFTAGLQRGGTGGDGKGWSNAASACTLLFASAGRDRHLAHLQHTHLLISSLSLSLKLSSLSSLSSSSSSSSLQQGVGRQRGGDPFRPGSHSAGGALSTSHIHHATLTQPSTHRT